MVSAAVLAWPCDDFSNLARFSTGKSSETRGGRDLLDLGDFARNVGGNEVDVTALVGPSGDVHVYSPTPGDAEAIRNARLVIVNGLGLYRRSS